MSKQVAHDDIGNNNAIINTTIQLYNDEKNVGHHHNLEQNPLTLLDDDVMLNILEFLDRSFVLQTLSVCSRYFHTLAHKPYHYSRLVWRFSKDYYEKLDHIKSYYSAVKVIEASDSEKFGEVNIDKHRLSELSQFIKEHEETVRGIDVTFNRNQAPLFDRIASVCGEWLSELSISVLLDTEFAKYVCSRLKLFTKLRVLRLLVGKSVDPNVILDSCGSIIGSMNTFETSLYLYSREHVEKFCACTKSLRNLKLSINCEVLVEDHLLQQFKSCCLEGKEKISILFFNVPSVSFLNQLKDASCFCRELNISIVEMKNTSTGTGNDVLSLQKVHNFTVSHASFMPGVNSFPKDARTINFSLSSKFNGSMLTLDESFGSRYDNLTRLEMSNISLNFWCNNLRNLEFVLLKNCELISVESILELSSKLQSVQIVDCNVVNTTLRFPEREHMRELVIQNKNTHGKVASKLHLAALKSVKHLHTLHLDGVTHQVDELQFLEELHHLEYLYFGSEHLEMFTKLKLEKLVNLKQFYWIYSRNDVAFDPLDHLFVNPALLHQCLLVLPPQLLYKFRNEQRGINITNNQIDAKILSALFPNQKLRNITTFPTLVYQLFNDKYIYLLLLINNKLGFVLIQNESPYDVLSWKILKEDTPSWFSENSYTRLGRRVSAGWVQGQRGSALSSCLIV